MTAQEIKDFCKEHKISYKELSKLTGFTEESLKAVISAKKISVQLEASMRLIQNIKKLEKDLQDFHALKELLAKLLNTLK